MDIQSTAKQLLAFETRVDDTFATLQNRALRSSRYWPDYVSAGYTTDTRPLALIKFPKIIFQETVADLDWMEHCQEILKELSPHSESDNETLRIFAKSLNNSLKEDITFIKEKIRLQRWVLIADATMVLCAAAAIYGLFRSKVLVVVLGAYGALSGPQMILKPRNLSYGYTETLKLLKNPNSPSGSPIKKLWAERRVYQHYENKTLHEIVRQIALVQ